MCGIGAVLVAGAGAAAKCASALAAVAEAIAARGPDSQRCQTVVADGSPAGMALALTASVLHMRGDAICSQPYALGAGAGGDSAAAISGSGSGDWFCFNGEVFEAAFSIPSGTSDTAALGAQLHAACTGVADAGSCAERVVGVLAGVRGPYALLLWHAASNSLWFARDPLGRRSLLLCVDAVAHTLTLSSTSVASDSSSGGIWEEVPPVGLYGLQLILPQQQQGAGGDSGSGSLGSQELLQWDVAGSGSIALRVWPWPAAVVPPAPAAAAPLLPLSALPPRGSGLPIATEEHLAAAAVCTLATLSAAVWLRVADAPVRAPTASTAAAAALCESPLCVFEAGTEPPVSAALSALAAAGYSALDLPSGPCSTAAACTASAASVAVMFSGGIDSMILALLAHAHVPHHQPIDLLNVSFATRTQDLAASSAATRGGASRSNKQRKADAYRAADVATAPDRLAAIAGLRELRAACPARIWRLVLIDEAYSAITTPPILPHLLGLLHPKANHMDFNIAAALWTTARGIGYVVLDDDEHDEAGAATPAMGGGASAAAAAAAVLPPQPARAAAYLRYGSDTSTLAPDGVQISLSRFENPASGLKKGVTLPPANATAATASGGGDSGAGLPTDGIVALVPPSVAAAAVAADPSLTARIGSPLPALLQAAVESYCAGIQQRPQQQADDAAAAAEAAASPAPEPAPAPAPVPAAAPTAAPAPATATKADAHGADGLRQCSNANRNGAPCRGIAAGRCVRAMCKHCCMHTARDAAEAAEEETGEAGGAAVEVCPVHKEKEVKAASSHSGDASSGGSAAAAAAAATAPPSRPRRLQLMRTAARVLLSGLGADEQCGGYGRHRTRFTHAGWSGLAGELALDVRRLWVRNLGRDDRVLSSHGRELRLPFLDEHFMELMSRLPLPFLTELRLGHGIGDKRLLRAAAAVAGLQHSTALVKRAIHFGSRIAKQTNLRIFGSNAKGSGDAAFSVDTAATSAGAGASASTRGGERQDSGAAAQPVRVPVFAALLGGEAEEGEAED